MLTTELHHLEEVQKIIAYPDRRIRAIVHNDPIRFTARSMGLFTVGHIRPIREGNNNRRKDVVATKILVYSGEKKFLISAYRAPRVELKSPRLLVVVSYIFHHWIVSRWNQQSEIRIVPITISRNCKITKEEVQQITDARGVTLIIHYSGLQLQANKTSTFLLLIINGFVRPPSITNSYVYFLQVALSSRRKGLDQSFILSY